MGYYNKYLAAEILSEGKLVFLPMQYLLSSNAATNMGMGLNDSRSRTVCSVGPWTSMCTRPSGKSLGLHYNVKLGTSPDIPAGCCLTSTSLRMVRSPAACMQLILFTA